jgi:hypothetical protein
MHVPAFVTLVAALVSLTATPEARRFVPAAPGQASGSSRQEPAVPFAVGETLTYDVGWSNFLVAGSAVMRVTEKRPSFGSIAYAVMADGRPLPMIARLYPLYYKMESLIDAATGLSQWSALYMEEGTQKHLTSTRFDRAARRANYAITNQPASSQSVAIPGTAQDGLSMIYALRSRALEAGDRFTAAIVDEGSLYSAEFTTEGPERVSVPLGERDAWKVRVRIRDAQGQDVGRNIALWISTDARRLPMKIEAELPVGTFALTLREAR